MSDILEKCERIMGFVPNRVIDVFTKKQLTRNLTKYQSSTEQKLAEISFEIDGKNYSSLLDAVYNIKEWNEMEIDFLHPNTEGRWEYDTPTKLIKITGHGRGGLLLFPVNPFALNQWNPKQKPIVESAMFRSYLSYFYSPESIKAYNKKHDDMPLVPPRPLCSPFELWKDIRRKGIVPFQMTLCAYTKKMRYLYQLDLLSNVQLKDFRDGEIPIAGRIFRDPMDYYHLDNLLSLQELPDLTKKVLQVFFESEMANVADIEIGMGITEQMAQNNISVLVKRGLVDTIGKPPKANYEINLENIRNFGVKQDKTFKL